MATLAGKPAYRQMTVEEFLELEPEGRAELEDGMFYLMAGGSFRRAEISGNIYMELRRLLRGSPCMPVGSDFAVRTGPATLRLPDASVYCDLSPSPETDEAKLLGDPRVIFEMFSPSTKALNQSLKLEEYRALAGTQAIVLVDPEAERVRLVERMGPEAWTDQWLPYGQDVPLAALGLTLAHSDIFARA